jgi:hypothetical protein
VAAVLTRLHGAVCDGTVMAWLAAWLWCCGGCDAAWLRSLHPVFCRMAAICGAAMRCCVFDFVFFTSFAIHASVNASRLRWLR